MRYGGRYVAENNNFCNTSSLQYILDAIENQVFGVDQYPTLIDKAAALAWWIIEGHIFNDGNKRTGMQAAIELLEMNGAITNFDSESIIKIALEVANGSVTAEELKCKIAPYVELPH